MSSPLPGGDDVNVRVILDVSGVQRGARLAQGEIKAVESTANQLGKSLDGQKLDPSGIQRGAKQAQQAIHGVSDETRNLKGALDDFSGRAALIGAPLVAGVALAVNAFASFEHQMNAVRAVTGATGTEFKALNDLALQIGRDTVFSASEAASALEELAKAGVSTKDILAGAAAGAVALAAAAGEGIPDAATQIANALNEFALAGDQATHVADVFANVSNKSAANAVDFGDALTYVGTTAHALGVPIEDVAAAIAAMADRGLKGSHAGTALGQALTALLTPTKRAKQEMIDLGISAQDANGNFVGLSALLAQVARATAGLGNAQRQAVLETLFGIEGGRAINALLSTQTQEAKAAGKSWDDYGQAVRVAGTAAEQAGVRNSGLAGSFEQLRGSVQTMEIEFGENLAPAVLVAANAITRVVNAFTALPEGAQTAIVATVALAGGLALTAAAGAKLISIGIGTVDAWRKLAGAFSDSQKACGASVDCLVAQGEAATVTQGKLSPLLGTLGKLAGFAGTVVTVEIAAQLTEHFGDDIAAKIDSAIAEGLDKAGLPGAADKIRSNLQEAADAATAKDVAVSLGLSVEKHREDTGILSRVTQKAQEITAPVLPDAFELDIEKGDDLIKGLNITLDEAAKNAAAAGLSVQDYLIKLADEKGVTTDQIAALKAQKTAQDASNASTTDAATATQDQTDALDEQTDTLDQQVQATLERKRAQEELDRAVQDALNKQFLAERAAAGLPINDFIRNAQDAAKAADEWDKSTANLITSFLEERGALVDLVPSIDGIQAPLAKASDTAEGTVLALNKVGEVRLSKANREALELGRTLDHVEDALARTDAAIQQNEGDLSMWQGRISLVTDALGGNTDKLGDLLGQLRDGTITQEQFNAAIEAGAIGPFQRLDALYAAGKISLEQYNAAKAAGQHLIERSAGGIQDEDAELVQNIIDLDRYATAHDTADGAVRRLTDSQREFLAATKSDSVQSFIQQFEALKSLGLDQEHLTKFVVSSADADPVLKAWLQDVGFLEKDHVVGLDASNANQILDDLQGKANAFVSLDGKTIEVSVKSREDALEFARRNADALDGKTVTFTIVSAGGEKVQLTLDQLQQDAGKPQTMPVDADTTQADKDVQATRDTAGKPVTLPVDVQVSGGGIGGAIAEGLGIGAQPETPEQPVIPPIVTPPADTSQTVASLDALVVTAGEKGLAAGDAAAVGIETGISAAPGKIVDDVAGIVASVSAIQDAMYNAGFNLGYSADAGLITGLAALAPQVYAAAQTIAAGVQATMAAALGVHSPSTKSAALARDYVAGIVIAFDRDRSGEQASRGLGNRIVAATELTARQMRWVSSLGGFDDPTQRAGFAGRAEIAQPTPVVVRGGHTVTLGDIHVTGAAGDPDQIANRVRTEVVDGINQLLSRRT